MNENLRDALARMMADDEGWPDAWKSWLPTAENLIAGPLAPVLAVVDAAVRWAGDVRTVTWTFIPSPGVKLDVGRSQDSLLALKDAVDAYRTQHVPEEA